MAARAGRSTPAMVPRTIFAVAMAAPVLPAVTKPRAPAFTHKLAADAERGVLLGADRRSGLLMHADHFRGMHDDDGEVFVAEQSAKSRFDAIRGTDKVDANGKGAAMPGWRRGSPARGPCRNPWRQERCRLAWCVCHRALLARSPSRVGTHVTNPETWGSRCFAGPRLLPSPE